MSLPPERLSRFARHIVLPELGGAGQVALTKAHVVLIGCGGIGSPALQYLAAAGIGRLTLVDSDVIEDSNLQRQTVFALYDYPVKVSSMLIGELKGIPGIAARM